MFGHGDIDDPSSIRTATVFAVVLGLVIATHATVLVGTVGDLTPIDPWEVGRRLLGGEVPYMDFPWEYPRGTLPFYVVAALAPHRWAPTAFASLQVVAELLIAWLLARRSSTAVVGRWFVLAALTFQFTAETVDAWVALAVLASTLCLVDDRAAGWWIAAAGAVVKLVPAQAWAWGRSRWRHAVAAGGVTVAVLVPSALLARQPDWSWFGYALERGTQATSLPGLTSWWSSGGSALIHRFGGWEVSEPSVLAAAAWLIIGAVGVAVTVVRARRGQLDAAATVSGTILWVIVASPVLSPQFLVWAAPTVAILGGRVYAAYVTAAAGTWLSFLAFDATDPRAFLAVSAVSAAALVVTALLSTLRGRPLA